MPYRYHVHLLHPDDSPLDEPQGEGSWDHRLCDIEPTEIVSLYLVSFDGTEYELFVTGADVASSASWHSLLRKQGIGYKRVQRFSVSTLSGFLLAYSRRYRNQMFKRERLATEDYGDTL